MEGCHHIVLLPKKEHIPQLLWHLIASGKCRFFRNIHSNGLPKLSGAPFSTRKSPSGAKLDLSQLDADFLRKLMDDIYIYIYWWSWWYIDDFPMIQWNSMIILQTLSFRLDFLDQATKGYLRNREEIVILRRQFQHSNSATGGHNNPSQECPNNIQQPDRSMLL